MAAQLCWLAHLEGKREASADSAPSPQIWSFRSPICVVSVLTKDPNRVPCDNDPLQALLGHANGPFGFHHSSYRNSRRVCANPEFPSRSHIAMPRSVKAVEALLDLPFYPTNETTLCEPQVTNASFRPHNIHLESVRMQTQHHPAHLGILNRDSACHQRHDLVVSVMSPRTLDTARRLKPPHDVYPPTAAGQ